MCELVMFLVYMISGTRRNLGDCIVNTVGALLTNCMFWFPRPIKLIVMI